MSDVLTKFTRKVPDWRPRITPVDLDRATPEQRDALKITPSNTKVSDYVLVLAHDPETLKVRSPLFNAIMYDRGGLSRAERELSAVAASVVNKCIFCAAVHADRHGQLTKDATVTEEIFRNGAKADLSPRDRAIFDAALALSEAPHSLTADHIAALRAAGLSEAQILDLGLSAALFGWANRLMHVLGDPVRKAEAP